MIIGSFVALIAIGALLSSLIFNLAPVLSLSSTRDAKIWSPFSYKVAPNRCAVDPSYVRGLSILRIAMYPSACKVPLPAKRLWVLGDSHAAAFTAMVGRLTADDSVTVEIRSTLGCALLGLRKAESESCAASTALAMTNLLREVKPDDVVFLPSLRIDRYVGQIQDDENHDVNKDADPAEVEAAISYLRQLTAKGTKVIFEAPLPVFRAPPFRCSDWFNSSNPICRPGFEVPRAEIERRRASVVAAEQRIVAEVPGISIWDPLPVLCGDKICRAFRDGKPLFFDGDHLSGYGDSLLYDSFRSALSQR